MTALPCRNSGGPRHEPARCRPDGRLVGRARCVAALRQGLRRRARAHRPPRHPVDVGRDIATVLRTLKPDVALNVLHGRPGEDGTLQGVLEILGIPYTHSGVLASALAMQKDVAKVVMQAAGIPVPEGQVVTRAAAAASHPMPRPYVIKPIAEGSSVGVFIVTEEHAHPPQELTRDGLGLRRTAAGRALHPRQGADLRRHRRSGPGCHRNCGGDPVLRLRGQIRPGAAPSTSCRHKFYLLFTKRSED